MIDVCILRLFGNTSRSFFLVIEFQNVVIALSRFIEWRVDGLRPMPRRVYIVYGVIGCVDVQVLCPRAVRIAAHRILLQEPACVRIIVTARQIVQAIAPLYTYYTKIKGALKSPFINIS